MKALSPADQIFLWLEKRQQPMHVGGLQLFNFPDDAGPEYVRDLADSLRSYTHPRPPFNQRLVTRFGKAYWDEDPHFDLEHHFRHEALPTPGRVRELLARISAEHSNLMDRERPLWESHLIEGLEGRRFALYTKMHHSMTDGVSAMRMGVRAFSTDPEKRNLPPLWAMEPHRSQRSSRTATDLIGGLLGMGRGAGKQFATIPTVTREITNLFKEAKNNSDHVSLFQAPESILNQRITGSRRFAAQSYSLERIRKIARAFGGTVNDVVLAISSSAIREYLISQHALPDKPLIAMVPVSIRQDDSEGGNHIAMILANLGTHIADPSHRMEVIIASVQEAKDRFARMSPEEALNYTALTMSPTAIQLLTGISPKLQAFNVIISNVRGPQEPLYWNGAKLSGVYPVSIPTEWNALNITILSYVDQLEFGITACRRTLPSMQRLLDYLETGIHELEIAAGIFTDSNYPMDESLREYPC